MIASLLCYQLHSITRKLTQAFKFYHVMIFNRCINKLRHFLHSNQTSQLSSSMYLWRNLTLWLTLTSTYSNCDQRDSTLKVSTDCIREIGLLLSNETCFHRQITFTYRLPVLSQGSDYKQHSMRFVYDKVS